MAKRLTHEQFEQVVSYMKIKPNTINIARRVLVDGSPQVLLVEETGLTKGAVSQAVNKVWNAHEAKSKGGERVSVVLPEHQAFVVKQWAATFADNKDKKNR